jgi:hypothetical protein
VAIAPVNVLALIVPALIVPALIAPVIVPAVDPVGAGSAGVDP